MAPEKAEPVVAKERIKDLPRAEDTRVGRFAGQQDPNPSGARGGEDGVAPLGDAHVRRFHKATRLKLQPAAVIAGGDEAGLEVVLDVDVINEVSLVTIQAVEG